MEIKETIDTAIPLWGLLCGAGVGVLYIIRLWNRIEKLEDRVSRVEVNFTGAINDMKGMKKEVDDVKMLLVRINTKLNISLGMHDEEDKKI